MRRSIPFADVLAEHLAGIRSETPVSPVSSARPTDPPLPPRPFLLNEPFRFYAATPYASMGRAQHAAWSTDTPRPSPAARSTPPPRRLTARQQRALDALLALGAHLRTDFTAGELRTAFRTLARRYHPDRHPGSTSAEATRLSRLFIDLTAHYRCLATLSAPISHAA